MATTGLDRGGYAINNENVYPLIISDGSYFTMTSQGMVKVDFSAPLNFVIRADDPQNPVENEMWLIS